MKKLPVRDFRRLTMSKNIYDHLENLTGQRASIDYDNMARKYATAIKQRREADAQNEDNYRRGRELNELHIDWMKRLVAEELEKETDRVDGNLPIISVFDAVQAAKHASNSNPKDMGLSRLVTHLEMKWENDRTANLNVSEILKLKDHYNRNYPRSLAASVIEKSSRSGYVTLPIGDLMELAANIRSQEDYDYYIKEAGLSGNNPFQKKARQFVLALLNGEADKAAQQNPNPQNVNMETLMGDPMAEKRWQEEGPFGDPNALVDQYEQDRSLVNQYEQERMQGESEEGFGEDQAMGGEESSLAKQYVDRARAAEGAGMTVKIDMGLPSVSIEDASDPNGGFFAQEWQAEELLGRVQQEIEGFDGQVTAEEYLLATYMS